LKTLTFIAITLLSGAIAGALLSIINQGLVEPYIDQAINIENKNARAQGEVINPQEFNAYRIWQKSGEIAAGTILGISLGALFGVVFAFVRDSIPGSNNKKKALILAAVMLLVIYIVPALKYPANPPAVGDPETIIYRETLYIAILAISGFSALGLAFLYRRMRDNNQSKKIIVPIIYVGVIATAFVIMPPNPDQITAPMDLVTGFRIVTGFTMSVFWGLLGLILGALWDKTKPHETTKIATV
jgi:predicted cobalt transporter CbtA